MYSHEQIEMRAHQLWLERGQPSDTPETDWFQAEAELRDAEPTFSKAARQLGTVIGSLAASARAAKALIHEKHPHPLTPVSGRGTILGVSPTRFADWVRRVPLLRRLSLDGSRELGRVGV
jgi:hypothetical protein